MATYTITINWSTGGSSTYSWQNGAWNANTGTLTCGGSCVVYAPCPSGYSSATYNVGGNIISSSGTQISGMTFTGGSVSSRAGTFTGTFVGGTVSSPANIWDWMYSADENNGTFWLHIANAESVDGAINSGGNCTNGWWNRADRRWTSAKILGIGYGDNTKYTYSSLVGGRTSFSATFTKSPRLFLNANGGSGGGWVRFNGSNLYWKIVSSGSNYQVQYINPNSQTGPDSSYAGYSNLGSTITTPTRTGYTFAGWSKTSGTIVHDETVLAVWKINSYYLDLNGYDNGTWVSYLPHATATVVVGGETKATNVTDYYTAHNYGSTYSITVTPNAGYHTSQTSYSGTIGAGQVNIAPNIIPNTYTIAYNSNGGSGTTSSQTATYNSTTALRSNSFTRSGYAFQGWGTTATSGVVYTAGQTVTNTWTTTNGGTITLYAQWAKLDDNFTTDVANGGTWWVNVNGTWKQASAYVNDSGTWRWSTINYRIK